MVCYKIKKNICKYVELKGMRVKSVKTDYYLIMFYYSNITCKQELKLVLLKNGAF